MSDARDYESAELEVCEAPLSIKGVGIDSTEKSIRFRENGNLFKNSVFCIFHLKLFIIYNSLK